MHLRRLGLSLVLAAAGCMPCVYAQNTNSGDLRGTITDTSGAVLPDVKVTVLNKDTGVSKDYVTNHSGVYDTGSILLGNYKITFTREGFTQLVREDVTLQVGITAIGGQLQVGADTQQVVVNTNVPLLTTETGAQSTTLEAKSMARLPNVGQDWENFAILVPGAQGTVSGNQGALASGASGQSVSINGNLPYNSVLADGATTTLSHSSNSDVNIFETVQEVKIDTSAFSAQYGIGGAIFNQISKGGTSQFHGALYEYFQNDALNAANYQFSQETRAQAVPFLRYNNFGGSIGGPILKKRMFFYFNVDKTTDENDSSGLITVPTVAMRSGDFTAPGLKPIYDPNTNKMVLNSSGQMVLQRTSFASEYGNGNRIPQSRLDTVASALQQYYPLPNVAPQAVVNGQDQNNYFYNVKGSNPYLKYFGRLDYDVSSNNRLTMSDTQRDNPAFFPNYGICPVDCQLGDVDSNNAQITDVWTISPTLINEARMGFTSQLNFYQPETLNGNYPAKVGFQFSKANVFPDIQIDDTCCTEALQPQPNASYKENTFDPSDVVTLIKGKNILHFGGELLFYRDDSTAWGNMNGGQLGYTGAYTKSTQGDNVSGIGYADFLLGQTNYWNANVTPEYGARQKSPQMFVQDDIQLTPHLTVNVGLRYQIQLGWHEIHGNEATFDPTIENAAVGKLGAFWYGSTHANGRDSLLSNVYNTVLPRAGFSYLLNSKDVFRGGFGVYAYNWSLDTYGSGMGAAFGQKGSVSDQTNGVTPVVTLDSSGSQLPFVAATTDPTAYNGQGVSYNMYHTPVPKIYQWNLGVQHEINADTVVELTYVASHGFNLNFPVDINQVPVGSLSANDAAQRPYNQYEGISGSTNNGISNYNSLQAAIRKRLTQGISFDFNYVWSHFLDTDDSSSWGSHSGTQIYQDASSPAANYGNSNFDVRDSFKGRVVWEIPVGYGRRFLNHSRILDTALGGWQASSTIVVQTGNPFTLHATGNDYSLAGNGFSQYPNVAGPEALQHRSIQQWFNADAFTQPAAGTFGDAHRNQLYGPGLSNVNLSLGKDFHVYREGTMQIRADATNVFNHPSFGLPNAYLSVCGAADATTGQLSPGCSAEGAYATNTAIISSTSVGGRTMQLGARFSF